MQVRIFFVFLAGGVISGVVVVLLVVLVVVAMTSIVIDTVGADVAAQSCQC